MGHYSQYSLKIEKLKSNGSDVASEWKTQQAILTELREDDYEAEQAIDANGNTNVSAKWYSHDVQLKRISSKYPDFLFVLEVVGEEYPDIHRKYFKQGKMYEVQAKISFEDFDESKLK